MGPARALQWLHEVFRQRAGGRHRRWPVRPQSAGALQGPDAGMPLALLPSSDFSFCTRPSTSPERTETELSSLLPAVRAQIEVLPARILKVPFSSIPTTVSYTVITRSLQDCDQCSSEVQN